METKTFNIFQVLEKDDKELIHSSFLQFLLTENDTIYEKLFRIKQLKFALPFLEKSYKIPNEDKTSKKKNSVKRIDIEATSIDNKVIVVIENKFKSFPYEQQLNSYDKIYDTHHKGKQKHKFLFCFDKSLVSFQTEWKIFDYNELLTFIHDNYFTNEDNEKLIFIKHYHSFLNDYYKKYKLLIADSKSLFLNPNNNENKFWLKLIYSALHLELVKYFKEKNIAVKFDLNPGTTKVPLLNIIPAKWKIGDKELLIQFQGNDLKFYSHSNDRNFIESIVQKAKEKFPTEEVKLKKMPKGEYKTCYIFQTQLSTKISDGKDFNLKNIMQAVIDFYTGINDNLIGQL